MIGARNILGLFALVAGASSALAGEIVLDRGVRAGIELVDDGLARGVLELEARVGRLEATEVTTPRGRFTRLSIPGQTECGPVGAPALPLLTRIVEVPLGARVTVRVAPQAMARAAAARPQLASPLYPRQPARPKSGPPVAFAHDARAYRARALHEEPLVELEELGLLRDRRLVQVKVAPVSYDAASNSLEVYSRVRVQLELSGADLNATARRKAAWPSPHFDGLGSILVPAALASTGRPARGAGLLVVSHRMFESALAPFLAFKAAQGFRVSVSYTDVIGATAEAVREHIRAQCAGATAENPAPEFVLLVGDHEQVPAFRGTTGQHVTDLYHACVAGDDHLPDLLLGRFSARSVAELLPQLDKTMYHERGAFADASFLGRATLVAGWDWSYAVEWGWPQIQYAVKYFFNGEHGMPEVSAFYSSGADQNVAEIIARANAGCAFINYAAHGSEDSWADPSFTIEDVNALANEGKYPLVVGNCCLTGKFEVGTCFGEAWLRADKKGAIGYIGGTNSTYWDEDLWWANGLYPIVHPNATGAPPTLDETGVGAYEALFTAPGATNGGMVLAGNLAVQASDSSRRKYYWEIYALFGDPTVRTRFGLPTPPQPEPPAGTFEILRKKD